MEQKCTLRAWIAIFRKYVCAGSRSRVWWVNSRESLPRGAFADPFIQVVDDLGAAIVEHQLRGSAFRSADGQSRCFAALERLFRPGRDKFPLDLRREPKDRCGYRGRQRLVEHHPILGDVHRQASLCGRLQQLQHLVRVDRAKRETSAATSTSPASAVSSSRPISRSLQDLRPLVVSSTNSIGAMP